MCLVITPYYHLCGHYGRPMVAPNGRCARAEHTPGACWEAQDIGIKTIEGKCINCERLSTTTVIHHPVTVRTGPVDCQQFNLLVKLHKQTFDRRRYCPRLSALPMSPAYIEHSASLASIPSSITSSVFLQTADELALRRFSTASEISTTPTSNTTISTEGQLPILTLKPSRPTIDISRRTVSLPISCIPAWTSVEEWTRQTHESQQNKNHGAQTM